MVQAPAIAIIHKTPCQSGTPRGAVGRVSGFLGGLSWETDVRVMVAALYPVFRAWRRCVPESLVAQVARGSLRENAGSTVRADFARDGVQDLRLFPLHRTGSGGEVTYRAIGGENAQGVRSGQLTPHETANLEHRESNINHEVAADRRANGGN